MVHVRTATWIPLAVALAACAAPPTQVVVRLATDMAIPDELNGIHLEILDGDGTTVRTQDLRELDAAIADGRYHEVGTFGLVPRGGDAGRRFEVRATALVGGTQLFITRASSSFVNEQTIRLDLYVPRLCVDLAMTCQPDETCGISGCVDPEIDPADLPSNEEAPPADPVDPRTPAAPINDAEAIRPLRPLLGERESTTMPTLQIQVAPDVDGVVIELCDDASCATSRQTPGTMARLSIDPSQRIHYWRAHGQRGGEIVQSPTYWFHTRPVDRRVDRTCGLRFDVEGDGHPELLVGGPGGPGGQAFLYATTGAAPNTWTATELGPPPGAVGFGSGFATGDIDGDGRMEILVAAPDTFDGGRVILYDAESLETPRDAYEAGTPGLITQRFGLAIAAVGDVDGDGYHDVAVAGLDAMNRAVVELWVGNPHGLEVAYVTRALDSATVTLAGGGDVDGDGYDDFVIGAPDQTPGGWAYRVRGQSDTSHLELLDAVPSGGPPAGAGYGAGVTMGDATGNGQCDVVVSAPDQDAGHLYLSFDGGSFEDVPFGGTAGEATGRSLALADLDDDGLDDLIATRVPIRGLMSMRLISGAELPSPLSIGSLGWTMPDGGGAVTLSTLGDIGGADSGSEIVAGEAGFGFGILADGFEAGNVPPPAGTMGFGAAVR